MLTRKINNEVVQAVPVKTVDIRKVRGANLYPELYANVFQCARKKSGKTSVVFTTVKKCAGPDTQIVVFCSTVNKDPSWQTIEEWALAKGLPFLKYTSLIDDNGVHLLKELIHNLQSSDDDEQMAETEEPFVSIFDEPQKADEDSQQRNASISSKKKSKYQSPDWIFVLDDLADELRSPIIATLLKKNRHFRAKVIISSQYVNDLMPAAMKQLDYLLLFKGHESDKLEKIRKGVDLSISTQLFLDVYKFATQKPFSFLYVDVRGGTFRRNFNELIEVQ